MSCQGFSREHQYTVILTFWRWLVSHYLSKDFYLFKLCLIYGTTQCEEPNKCSTQTRNISWPYTQASDYFNCENIENISIPNTLYEKYASTLYDKHGETFNILFRMFLYNVLKILDTLPFSMIFFTKHHTINS